MSNKIRIQVRFDQAIHARLGVSAKHDKRSLNQQIMHLLDITLPPLPETDVRRVAQLTVQYAAK